MTLPQTLRVNMTGPHNILGVLAAVDSTAIVVHQERCAKVRNRNVECLKCAQACTSGCIAMVDGQLQVDDAKCVGCGTCATVCPTCALEARNPTDAELLRACLQARRGDEVTIVCEQLRRAGAKAQVLDEQAVACVVCLGRVEESLLAGLVAQGVGQVHLACGNCAQCEQKQGLSTAQTVVKSAQALLKSWGSAADVRVEEGLPVSVRAANASEAAVQHAIDTYFATLQKNEPLGARQQQDVSRETSAPLRVMKDGTLPHFVPDRRESLLNALAQIGEPCADSLETRLWGCVVIDGAKCSSCRMCATFCPTGAIRKFDNEDATFGVDHFPGDCVKCGSCRDICPEEAILLLDQVKPAYILEGARHHYVMQPRAVETGNAQQIVNTMRERMKGSDIFER